VNQCDHSDAGTYHTQMQCGIDQTKQTAKLNIRIQPKVEAPKSVSHQSCIFGQDTQISWKFSGNEKPQVTWFFNGQPLLTNDRFQVTEIYDGTSTLWIRQAELAYQGDYIARAINAVGEAEAK
ncbi:unnamed protein product, partial [Rotaria sp. Silwood1]